MTHKIAIIKTFEYTPGYGDDGTETIVQSITEWEEVTDDEFKTLRAASNRLGFIVLEQPTEPRKFIAKTVADYKAYVLAEEARLAEEKQKREEAALERKFKKELKDKESKIRMLKKLQEELGTEVK
jgi:hypothetical protein